MAITLENRDCDRFRQQVARMEQGNVDLLFVGDSITHFWENAGKEVWDEYYGSRNAMNFAISGDRTGHVLWRLANSPLDKISPKMAVVMIGTNNVGHDSSTPAQTVEGIQQIIAVLRNKYPTMKILLLEVFPREEKPDAPRRLQIDEINKGLREVFNNVDNVQLYSINDLFLTEDGILTKEIMPDLLHPGPEGYKIWAKAIEPMIADGLGETPEACIPSPRPDDWWVNRYNEKNDLLKKGDIDLLMIGDSITHGWEGAGADVWNIYYGNRKPINLGIGGDQVRHVLWRLDNYDFSNVNPRLAMLLIGVNDTWAGTTPAKDIALGNRRILTKLHSLFPELKIIALRIFPCTSQQNQIDQINALLPYYLRDLDYVTQMDIGHVFLNARGELTKDIMPDLLHPNTLGYVKWAEAVEPTIASLLNEAPNMAVTLEDRNIERFQQQSARMEQGNVDLLFVGDSITHGWEGAGKDVWEKYYGNRNAMNFGIGGDRTGHVLWRLANSPLDKISPKMAVVMIGTNNIGHNSSSPEQTVQGIWQIVDRLKVQYPEMKILLLEVFPRGSTPDDNYRQQVNKINEGLRKIFVNVENVQLLGLENLYLDENGVLPVSLMPDMLHPNAEGYEIWANAIEPMVKEALGETK